MRPISPCASSGAHARSRCLTPTSGKLIVASTLLAALAEVDDDTLAPRRVLDVVADAQAEGGGVARLRGGALAGGDRRLDDPVAVSVAAIPCRPARRARRRRRYGGGAPRSRARCRPRRLWRPYDVRPDTLPWASTSSSGISSRNRDGGL